MICASDKSLTDLLKNPPAGEGAFLVDLLENRIPPGVDEAAYVKAGFLTGLASKISCTRGRPWVISPPAATPPV